MATEVTKATPTCCGKNSGSECVCGKSQNIFFSLPVYSGADISRPTAKQATCSCGKQSALHCTCQKAAAENALGGARCSCRARPAGQCTCENAAKENIAPTGSTCECGSRPAGSCTCERAAAGASYPNEIDFTTTK
ncbi:hypothetical protein FHL15_006961 [Xylaria flabelliformis]|uniref:DUF7871 domain-containing protein n=1 Tax=Xylaria flabelliformis TaxID=2512241 RepID=A0A553HVW2_9PEZI|nr:hypothetical protein FHL15_006961 [Xylaria flabelliformis]